MNEVAKHGFFPASSVGSELTLLFRSWKRGCKPRWQVWARTARSAVGSSGSEIGEQLALGNLGSLRLEGTFGVFGI